MRQKKLLLEKLRDLRDFMPRHWSPCYLKTPCHASGHLVIYRECYTDVKERFLLSGIFYFTLLSVVFKASLGAGSSASKLEGLHVDLRNISPARLFV